MSFFWIYPSKIHIKNVCFPRFSERSDWDFFFQESIGAAVGPPVKQTKMDVILKLQGLVFGGFEEVLMLRFWA
jgi:hypothetical protein